MEKQNETMTRENLLTRMANAYYELLTVLVPLLKKNSDIENGIREGLNKFLSNLCISLVGKQETDYYSEDAIDKLNKGDCEHLIYEHIVPKNFYQNQIIDDFKAGKIKNAGDIRAILEKYWYIATITSSEDKQLKPQKSMPKDWDKQDIFVRYAVIRSRLKTRAECRGADFPVKKTINQQLS